VANQFNQWWLCLDTSSQGAEQFSTVYPRNNDNRTQKCSFSSAIWSVDFLCPLGKAVEMQQDRPRDVTLRWGRCCCNYPFTTSYDSYYSMKQDSKVRACAKVLWWVYWAFWWHLIINPLKLSHSPTSEAPT